MQALVEEALRKEHVSIVLPLDGKFKAGKQVPSQEQTKLRQRNVQELLFELLLWEQTQATASDKEAEDTVGWGRQGSQPEGR